MPANSTPKPCSRKRRPGRPSAKPEAFTLKKPYKDFPLTAHSGGKWMKKIGGRLRNCFRSGADRCKNQSGIDLVMGHSDGSLASEHVIMTGTRKQGRRIQPTRPGASAPSWGIHNRPGSSVG